MNLLRTLPLFILLFLSNSIVAQSFQDMDWLRGQWEGEAFGGKVFENWAGPYGDEMTGTFQLVSEDKTSILEFMVIRLGADTMEFFFNHFNSDLQRWEDSPIKMGLLYSRENEFKFINLVEGKTAPRSLKYTYNPEKRSLVVVVEEWEKTSAGYESFSVTYQKN